MQIESWIYAMASKFKVFGLQLAMSVDNYLITQDDGFVGFLCQEYKIDSLVAFCVTGKFLDQL